MKLLANKNREYNEISSPLGHIIICAENDKITLVEFADARVKVVGTRTSTNKVIQECARQLEQYFAGTLKRFHLPLHFEGTELQRKTWKFLQSIPYGETASYQEQAEAIGNIKAVRAVANANGKNFISIIVPCHRVIGKNGTLTGYGGGLWRKEWLLKHEGAKFRK